MGQSYTYCKGAAVSSRLRSPFYLRNSVWVELIMDEWVIIGALMRALNYVLSLSFERCGNDLTVIVLIPVATLANEMWGGCRGRILETKTSPNQM